MIKKLKEFDEWFTNIKIELERRDEIIDRYRWFYYIRLYGKIKNLTEERIQTCRQNRKIRIWSSWDY